LKTRTRCARCKPSTTGGDTLRKSAEFDAALIAARRAAGVYGPKRHRRQMLLIAVGIAAGLVVVALLIV